MNSVEMVRQICKERKIPISRLEADCGFSNGYIRGLRSGKFPADRLSVIADYLGLPLSYFLEGKEEKDFETDLKKSRDLKVQFDQIRRLLQTSKMQPLYFDGQEVDQESIDLLMKQIEVSFAIIQRATD